MVDWNTNLRGDTMDNDNVIGGYEVPQDPMDLLQCEGCQ